jgi:hypothetical protein
MIPVLPADSTCFVEAALHAIEERRRDAQIAVRGVFVGHALDVAVDAEDLHDDDQRASRLARRLGDVRRKLVPVRRGQLDTFTHVLSPNRVFSRNRDCVRKTRVAKCSC